MSHTLPRFSSAATNAEGTKVFLTYTNLGWDSYKNNYDRLSSNTAPPSAFTVRANGVSATINSVVASGTTVELRLATPIQSGESVTVDYRDPSGGNDAYAIQNANWGEDASSFSNASVTNNSTFTDTSSPPPLFQSAGSSEDGTKVILTFDQDLSADTAAPDQFALTVDGSNVAVDSVSSNGSAVELTLASAIQSGQSVSLAYSDPSASDDANAIQLLSDGTDAASFSNASVTNTSSVATPNFQSASSSEDGTKVILIYDQELSTDTPAAADFAISVDGSSVDVVGVYSIATGVELMLERAIQSGQSVSLDYTDPTNGDDAYAIQQLSYGTDAPSISNAPVINNSDVVTPVFQSASTSSDGTKIILAYDQDLSPYTAAPDHFAVTVNDTSVEVIAVAVNGSDVELTLSKAIKEAQTVSLAYSEPSAADDINAIQQLGYGTDAASISNVSVMNASIVDGTPPSFVGFSFLSPTKVAEIGGSGTDFDLAVEDDESDISLIELIFESPDGGDDVTINIDYSPNLGLDNVYRSGLDIPQSEQPGGIQGGFWKIKSLRLKDSFENERLYRQDELPDTGFWVNNPVTSKQSIVGNREVGQTLTINTDTIADADIDNLAPGTFTPDYQYRWQISDNGVDGWQDVNSQSTYTLTEADANKYFRSIVSYDGKDGVITETLEGDPFQFTEGYSGSYGETFEDGLSNGWKYAGTDTDAPVSYNSSLGHFVGRLPYTTTIEKTYQAGGGGTFSFDFLYLDSWDASHGDAFSVSIDGVDVLSDIRRHSYDYEKSIHNGETNGFVWSLDTTERFNTYSRWGDMRVRVSIDLPDDVSSPTIKITSKVNQGVDDESGGVDNINFDWGKPATVPLFSSLESASTLERGGSGNFVYQAAATDRSGVTYSLEGVDPGVLSIDPATGAVRLLEEAEFSKRESYDFTVRATDLFGNFSDRSVNLAVEDSSRAFWKEGGYRIDSASLKGSAPSAGAITLRDSSNRKLSDATSRAWDGVAVIKTKAGYRMLQVGERGRRQGQYRIAELNADGILQSVGAWVDTKQAVADRYEEIFKLDLNNDGQAVLPTASDSDLDGFADGLDHYRLIGTDKTVDLRDQSGRVLSSNSSRNWNAVSSQEVADGFEVLIQGLRGRRTSSYQVWSTDANGQVTRKSSWLNPEALAQQGYAPAYTTTPDIDPSDALPAISASSDANSDGFVDGLGYYMLMGETLSSAVDFTDQRGKRLTPNTSRNWNAVASKDVGDGFEVLIKGTRGRRASTYQVWSTDANGQVTSKSSWLNANALSQQGYETTFNQDFNNDTFVGDPVISPSSDANGDGFVDGLGHYMLMGGCQMCAVDFTDQRGRRLSSSSSRNWNALLAAPKVNDSSSGYEVLIQGERGRRNSLYQVWSADDDGKVTTKTRWLDRSDLADEGYEQIFNRDFNGDDLIGAPAASLTPLDQDNNGLVDGITHYALLQGDGDNSRSLDLRDRRGRVLSDTSSRQWNVIQAEALGNGDGFEVLLKGERGRRRSQYLLWKADSTGLITEQSRWLSGNQLALDGYESIFDIDFNSNGSIGF